VVAGRTLDGDLRRVDVGVQPLGGLVGQGVNLYDQHQWLLVIGQPSHLILGLFEHFQTSLRPWPPPTE
jgi:hypothetical protein